MFELSVAFKYLVPRWRQLSVSIISLISIFVIALVVWLIVVFFSVTQGLEKNWVQKLIALTAPVRVSPTNHYYNSYYYLADSISMNSNYTTKSIGEKLASPLSDPYDPDFDQEIPPHWVLPDLNKEGKLKDPVKLAFSAFKEIKEIPGLAGNEYEMTVTNIKLNLIRGSQSGIIFTGDPANDQNQSSISQATYLGSYDPDNPNLAKAMLPVSKEDVQNLIDMAWVDSGSHFSDSEYENVNLDTASNPLTTKRLKDIFDHVRIKTLQTTNNGQKISSSLLPSNCRLQVCVLKVGKHVNSILIPSEPEQIEEYRKRPFNERVKALSASLEMKEGKGLLKLEDGSEVALNDDIPLLIDSGITLEAEIDAPSLEQAKKLKDIQFNATMNVQGEKLAGKIHWDQIQIETFGITNAQGSNFWLFKDSIPLSLPSDSAIGDAILLPKSYRSSGVLIGDRGQLSYQTATATSVQEQRVPIYIAGFYDPGILPLGGKIILANQYLTSMIRSSYPNDQSPLTNGINVRFDDLDDAEKVKIKLELAFTEAGIDKYWRVETYRDFDFTKDFLQQLRSERNLFTLISAIVIIVACANIVSMLIILVNNKKMEIGILRSMGASSKSIALIFGTCGIVMGLVGSTIGLIAALFTLRNLQVLIGFISRLQGFDAFNPVFYGDTLPNEISFEALIYVVGTTALTSLIAGVIPAVKASLMKPSAILRSE